MDNPRAEKVAVVDEVRQRFDQADAVILTEYRGLKVKELAALRRSLTPAGGDYKVYKNTLVRFAARDAGLAALEPLLVGPTAVAFVNGDAAAVAKALRDFSRTQPLLVIKGGVLGDKLLTSADTNALAELPSRDVLLSRIAGGLAAPLTQLAGLLQALPRNLAYGLAALRDQLAEASPASSSDATSSPSADDSAADDSPSASADDSASDASPSPSASSDVTSSVSSEDSAPASSDASSSASADDSAGDASASASSSEDSAPAPEAVDASAPSRPSDSAEPPSTEPPSTEPPSTEPSSTEPSSTEPPSTEPPSTEASSTEASSTEPPSTEASDREVSSAEASSAEPTESSDTE